MTPWMYGKTKSRGVYVEFHDFCASLIHRFKCGVQCSWCIRCCTYYTYSQSSSLFYLFGRVCNISTIAHAPLNLLVYMTHLSLLSMLASSAVCLSLFYSVPPQLLKPTLAISGFYELVQSPSHEILGEMARVTYSNSYLSTALSLCFVLVCVSVFLSFFQCSCTWQFCVFPSRV